MEDRMDVDKDVAAVDDHEYPSICIPSCDNKTIIHLGQPDFDMQMNRYFPRDEMKARHQVMRLKRDLNTAKGDAFWSVLEEGMSNITGSQYAFVAKRILKDDSTSAIEMPHLGEEGSCLMGLVYFIKDDAGKKLPLRNVQYKGYKCPCAHMRHDKTLVIPDHLHSMFPENPNPKGFPFPAEAYLAIPLWIEGKCFGHMGVMWSRKGLDNRPGLSWAYIECIFRSLEDLVISRLLANNKAPENGRHKSWAAGMTPNIVPKENITTDQTIRPAARTLSHELRTPLQGVVGMLEVMSHALDQLEEQLGDEQSPVIKSFVSDMKRNIEHCQDSSQRVVDAADNIVHALELNTEMAEPQNPTDLPDAPRRGNIKYDTNSTIVSMPKAIASDEEQKTRGRRNPKKRSHSPDTDLPKRYSEGDVQGPKRISPQRSRTPDPPWRPRPLHRRPRSERANSTPPDERMGRHDETFSRPGNVLPLPPTGPTPMGTHTIHQDPSGKVTLHHKRLNLKEFISSMLQNALKSGGRPEKVQVASTKHGQNVKATRTNARGEVGTLEIDWSVEFVPPIIVIDKLTLEKTLYAVLHNAVKFTANGFVKVTATVPEGTNEVLFKIKDTGPGIQPNFIPHVFKMWKRADESLNRRFDGAGLGLFVAQSLAMKLGGDIRLFNTSCGGPNRGSEFHIILPMQPLEGATRVLRTESPVLRPKQEQLPSTHEMTLRRAKSGVTSAPVSPAIITKSPSLPLTPQPQSPALSPPMPSATIKQTPKGSLVRRLSKGKEFDRELGKKIPLRILVAEDNQINRGILVSMLKRLGYTNILEAIDGEDAVRIVKESNNTLVNLILMDLWMPRMNGIEATEKIMALPQYTNGHAKRLVVLAVSADASQDAQNDVERVGMAGFLKKPHTLSMLEQVIKEHCGAALNGITSTVGAI